MMVSLVKNDDGVYRLNTPFSNLAIGVIAKSANRVDYALESEVIRGTEKKLIQRFTGIETKNIVALNQMHQDTIYIIREMPAYDTLFYGEADGFLTRHSGICLIIRTADCVPVFAYDPFKGILGAVHSGWRGTRLSIARKLVREMKHRWGSAYRDVRLYLLPSIGPESYTVGRDVADLFPNDITEKEGMLYLNLWQHIDRSVREEGIPADNIFCTDICTLKSNDEFFSYRGGDVGRNLNFGYLT
jgi:YfiH family protein